MAAGIRRKQFKLEPLNLEEMMQDPSMRGMLSFLDVPPEEKAKLVALREDVERTRFAGESPAGTSDVPPVPISEVPPGVITELPPGGTNEGQNKCKTSFAMTSTTSTQKTITNHAGTTSP